MSDVALDPSLQDPTFEVSTQDAVAPEPEPACWSLGTRLAFRFAFCYFVMYALCCGNATVWEVLLPVAGDYVSSWLAWPFAHAAQWLGQHVFHLTGVAAKLHGGGSGDRALDWIAVGVMLGVAVVATLVWIVLDRRRTAYPKMFTWFRFILRLTLGVAMMNYGMAKVVPLQMSPPSLAVLNEPFGNLSPMTLLWTMIGYNPVYEMICGGAEVVAGLLILFRRTALLGALITAFVVTNVVLYNFFFDVPVKIYAAHLLLMSTAVIVPDVRSLFAYFWLHRPSTPSPAWYPVFAKRWKNITTLVIEYWILAVSAIGVPVLLAVAYFFQLPTLRMPVTLQGQWHVQSALLNGQYEPYITAEGKPLTDLFFEPSGRTMARDSDSVLWRAQTIYNSKKQTLKLECTGVKETLLYAVTQPDPQHLVLTPMVDPKDKKAKPGGPAATLTLVHVPLPQHYPLLERGFHFVNEWGLER